MVSRLSRIVAAGVLAGAFSGVVMAAATTGGPNRLVYRINHSKHGDVGTYTNIVDQNGDSATVTTQGRIKVSVLGVTAYRQEFDRVEHWKSGQLQSFHSVTTENGDRNEVNAAAQGDHLSVSTPAGTISAPKSAKLANPWSDAVLTGNTIITPDEGKVEKVNVSSATDGTVMLNGEPVLVRRYQIQREDGQKRYDVWFDREGIPVKFAMVSPKETVTFTLSACEGPSVCRVFTPQAIAQK